MDFIPEDEVLQKLMLLGAMYVEENGMLESIHDNIEEDTGDEELKEVLVQAFCSLDMNMEGVDTEDVLQLLNDAWGISSRMDFIQTLDSLLAGRHQNMFDDLVEKNKAKALSLEEYRNVSEFSALYEEMDNATYQSMVKHTLSADPVWAIDGLIGWDWARYVHLLRLGFLAKIIKQDEAWTLLKRLRKPVKERFKDWQSFGRSFQNGRLFWAGSDDTMSELVENLKSDPWSPWLKLGWF